MASVEIRAVQKFYGATQILHDIDLTVEDREFVILVGPSGCGKSTLLRIIAGLEGLSGGDIRIAGQSVANLPAKERDIAMVFQNYALYPHMTVFNNLAFSMKLKGVEKREVARRVAEAARILKLDELLSRRPSQLSGGQRQRVAMGRAIVRNPKVFLFDEPLSNLDAKLRVQMRAEIKTLHESLQATMVYVTHDQIEAMTMADRIVVMNQGRIEQVGRPLDLYDQPKNVFVAGFIGSPSINLLRGKVSREHGAMDVRIGELVIPIARPVTIPDGADVVCGLRPEHIQLGGNEQGSGGRVIAVEPTGAQTYVTIDTFGETLLLSLSERQSVSVGDSVRWQIAQANVLLFDAETGVRV